MSTPLICAKPEDLDTNEKRRRYTACIIGCGQTGILQAVSFADAGFKVVCYDSDQTILDNLVRGRTRYSENETEDKLRTHVKNDRIRVVNDIKEAVSHSNIIIVTVSPKIDSKKKIDYSSLENLYKKIGQSVVTGSLIVTGKPAGIGIFEGMIKEKLENASGFKIGIDIAVAYSPLHYRRSQHVVASMDKNSLNVASMVLTHVVKGELRKTSDIKAAELAGLFVIQQKDVADAFRDELTQFCEKARVDYMNVNDLLRISSNSLLSLEFDETLSVDDAYILLTDAENLNLKPRILEAARNVNEQAAKRVVNLIKDGLASCGKTPRRARVALLGLSEKPNMRGHPKKIVKEVAQTLTAKGSRVSLYDPYFSESSLLEPQFRMRRSITEAVEGSDCLVISAGHDQFKRLNLKKLKMMMKKPSVIIDLEGIIEPDKVEKEGFIYRGLGRGVWTK